MREDYVNSNFFKIVIFINKIFNRKHKISVSNGAFGQLGDRELKDIVEKIKKDGYYIFNKKISVDKVEKIKKFANETPLNYLQIVEGKARYSENKLPFSQSYKISNRHQFLDASDFNKSEELLELIFDQNFLHIAQEYLGVIPKLDLVTMWWSNPLPLSNENNILLKKSAAQMFHFDLDRLKFIKFFVYITDVDSNTGPHVYVKKSHKKIPPYIKNDGRYSDEFIFQNDSENVVEICGSAGTIIAADTRGIHKGKELFEGNRLIFQLEFTNSLFGNPEYQKINTKFDFKTQKDFYKSYELFATNN